MKQLLVIFMCFTLLIFETDLNADVSSKSMNDSHSPIGRKYPTVLVAGSGFKGAEAVAERLREQLEHVPRIEMVFVRANEIVINVWGYRNERGEAPSSLPIEARTLPSIFEGIPIKVVAQYVMPPPSDFILLKPNFEYEQVKSCPSGYDEIQEKGWHFCTDSTKPEAIPPIMSPPVAGMPYMKAYKIYNSHRRALSALPGVGLVSLGEHGIIVEASDASQIPKEVDGLPIEVRPIEKREMLLLNHSQSSQIRPVVGGVSIGVETGILNSSDLVITALGYAAGGLWLVFPAHATPLCSLTSPCQGHVGHCLRRYSPSNPRVEQPSSILSNPTIGQVVKWGNFINNAPSWDVAAAWFDNDSDQGNSSICSERMSNIFGAFDGRDVIPSVDTSVAIYTARTLPGSSAHLIIPGTLTSAEIDYEVPASIGSCGGSIPKFQHLITLHTSTTNGEYPVGGDSGSPIFTGNGRLVGMLIAVGVNKSPDGSVEYDGKAYGHLAGWMRDYLGIDRWYGTATFPDNSQICQ